MAISQEILDKVTTGMTELKKVFKAPDYEIRLRSPGRVGGDREISLNHHGEYVANVHVKKTNYKLYVTDTMFKKSKMQERYEQKNGGKYIHLDTLEECIEEILSTYGENISSYKRTFKVEKENPIDEVEYLVGTNEIVNEEAASEEYIPIPRVLPSEVDVTVTKIVRDVKQAQIALNRASYQCEFNPKHESFTRISNGKNYTEPHHLIPISQQEHFEYSLDVPANIISLCSNCHNCIHYGKERTVLLKVLYEQRKIELSKAGLDVSFEELMQMY